MSVYSTTCHSIFNVATQQSAASVVLYRDSESCVWTCRSPFILLFSMQHLLTFQINSATLYISIFVELVDCDTNRPVRTPNLSRRMTPITGYDDSASFLVEARLCHCSVDTMYTFLPSGSKSYATSPLVPSKFLIVTMGQLSANLCIYSPAVDTATRTVNRRASTLPLFISNVSCQVSGPP